MAKSVLCCFLFFVFNVLNSQVNNPKTLFYLTLYKGKPADSEKVVLSGEGRMRGLIIYDGTK